LHFAIVNDNHSHYHIKLVNPKSDIFDQISMFFYSAIRYSENS